MTTARRKPGPVKTWTRERVAAAMRTWRKRMGRWPTVVDWTPSQARRHGRVDALAEWEAGDYPHASTVANACGSWGAALALVSRTPRTLPYARRTKRRADWTREDIIDAVKRWAAQHDGQPPSYQQWDPAMANRRGRADMAQAFYAGHWPHASVAARRMGGRWGDVLIAAGFAEREPGAHDD